MKIGRRRFCSSASVGVSVIIHIIEYPLEFLTQKLGKKRQNYIRIIIKYHTTVATFFFIFKQFKYHYSRSKSIIYTQYEVFHLLYLHPTPSFQGEFLLLFDSRSQRLPITLAALALELNSPVYFPFFDYFALGRLFAPPADIIPDCRLYTQQVHGEKEKGVNCENRKF